MAEKLYVLGHPVAHSKSPVMHNAAYRALGLHWEYDFADCPTEMSARVFLNARNWRACNVTMPWKPLALEVATTRSEAAILADGANVLVHWAGRVHADNTDGKGCVSYLQRRGANFEGARVAVCGTGPTSLAIMHASAAAGARQVCLFGRDATRTERVLDGYRQKVAAMAAAAGAGSGAGAGVDADVDTGTAARSDADVGAAPGTGADTAARTDADADAATGTDAGATTFEARAYDAAGEAAISAADIVIDATPLGMKPGDPAPFNTDALSTGQVVFDVVYGHGETALMVAARAKGCNAFDGAGMLVAQAVETVRDISEITGFFDVPAHMDLFAIMADAAGFAM